MNKLNEKNRGITIVGLVVTIVMLLILAAVVISLIRGQDGLFAKADKSAKRYTEESQNEEDRLSSLNNYLTLANLDGDNSEIITALVQELNNLKQEVNTLKNNVGDKTPVGTIIAFMGGVDKIPANYLECNGDVFTVEEYPELFEVLKTADHTGWASADWTTQFSLPDLRGEFLRGCGTATRNTGSAGSTAGIHQDGTKFEHAAMYNNNTTRISYYIGDSEIANNGSDLYRDYDKRITTSGKNRWYNITVDSVGEASGKNIYFTSRPTNTSVLYIIKAK